MSRVTKSAHDRTLRTRFVASVTDAVESVNRLQDWLVSAYFRPYSIAFTYWAFSFIFLYIGIQKVVPHRSAADVQLARIGAIVGIPYLEFVLFIGVWQLIIGGLFLLRRLRLCAWFFFSYQFFTISTVVVLNKIVFQPPWIHVFGFEIPWALGSYAAFVLKNLVFAAIFFVLASQEFDVAGDRSGDDSSDTASTDNSGSIPARVLEGHLFATPLSNLVSGTVERLTVARRHAAGLVNRSDAVQNYVVGNYFRPHGVTILYLSYGFIWFYFGFQKPAPVYSPVRLPLSEFFPHFGIPLDAGMVFIGTFEMFLGLLFFFRQLRLAFWLFLGHQAVTLVTLFVIPFVAFQPPYISLLGVRFPWALTGYGAFVIKNVVFIAGFTLLASIELDDTGTETERNERKSHTETGRQER